MVIDRPRPAIERVPPICFFAVSAIFHYLGPCFAVLLFSKLDVLAVAFLRIWTAAFAFALWRRFWRNTSVLRRDQARLIVALGIVLAAMNGFFYLAIARLPLATVSAIEFLGTVLLAAYGSRTLGNVAALTITILGVAALTELRWVIQPLGFIFAFANCVLFVAYIVLAHRVARTGARIDSLAAAMLVAAAVITPFGFRDAMPALASPTLLLAGFAVGICSSFIPYITDQLAMARLPRASFALMLATLPVAATVIAAIVLRQFPSGKDLVGIGLVTLGVAMHRQEKT
jgi:inner membrane transporter RhtA